MKHTAYITVLLLCFVGCSRSTAPDQRSLFFAKHPRLKKTWTLEPTSTHQLAMDHFSKSQAMLVLIGAVRKRSAGDTNMLAYLDWVEENVHDDQRAYADHIREIDAVLADDGYMYYYENETEAGYACIRDGNIVEKWVLVSVGK